jgi:hypothetical protein
MTVPRGDIAFTPTVKAIQAARGSREAYAKMEARGGFNDRVTDDLAAFLAGKIPPISPPPMSAASPMRSIAADRWDSFA